ncbi:MAG: 30S ribosomal protein S4 [Thaumarchaeota archaeon]|nr:30S ribosomal protein S4 [Nitrososphaerota archaeon]
MGDPKYPRRVWRKPKRPFNYELKMEELKTLGTFGLKTKRELWKARTELSRLRKQARSLLALRQEVRQEKEPILMKSLSKIGLVGDDSTLDDVLNLKVTDLLSRRLQTVVLKKFGFKTPYQARQAVVHGHIMIGDRIVNIPSYTVSTEEENNILISPDSSLENLLSKSESVSEELKSAEQPFETKAEAATKPQSVEQPVETKAEAATKPQSVEQPVETKAEAATKPQSAEQPVETKAEAATEEKVEKSSTEQPQE